MVVDNVLTEQRLLTWCRVNVSVVHLYE